MSGFALDFALAVPPEIKVSVTALAIVNVVLFAEVIVAFVTLNELGFIPVTVTTIFVV